MAHVSGYGLLCTVWNGLFLCLDITSVEYRILRFQTDMIGRPPAMRPGTYWTEAGWVLVPILTDTEKSPPPAPTVVRAPDRADRSHYPGRVMRTAT